MAIVTFCSDFAAQESKTCHCFQFLCFYLPWSDQILVFRMLRFKPVIYSPLSPLSRGSSVPLLSALIVVSSAFLRLIFLLAVLKPAYDTSSPAFHIMYSAYKLNKQDDHIQPWCTPFPIWNPSAGPCPILTIASWPAYRFLTWETCIPISFRIFHSLLWSTQSKALAQSIKQK